jgi:hypothetical protein
LTDTIHHLRAQNMGNLDGGPTKNETLVALGLSYRDGLKPPLEKLDASPIALP